MSSSVTQPALAGHSLPYPRTYRKTHQWRAGSVVAADGTISFDLMVDTPKHRFELSWQTVSEAGVGNIETAYAAMGEGSATFVDPLGATYTVTRAPDDQGLTIDWQAVHGAFYGNTSIVLIEV